MDKDNFSIQQLQLLAVFNQCLFQAAEQSPMFHLSSAVHVAGDPESKVCLARALHTGLSRI